MLSSDSTSDSELNSNRNVYTLFYPKLIVLFFSSIFPSKFDTESVTMQTMRRTLLTASRDNNVRRCLSSQEIIKRDETFGGLHFKPLPVVLERGEGVYLWDVDGKRYLDFLAGFSTVNQGHCHPRLVSVMRDQAGKLCHSSRAFFCDLHGELAEYLTKLFGYDRFIPMNTGKIDK